MNNNEEVIQAACIEVACKNYSNIAPTITANYNNVGAGVEKGKAIRMVGVEVSKGLKSGEPDLTIYYNKRAFHIEIKTEEGSLSKNQKRFIPFLQKQDIPVFLCRSVPSFLEILGIIENIKDEGLEQLWANETKHLIKKLY